MSAPVMSASTGSRWSQGPLLLLGRTGSVAGEDYVWFLHTGVVEEVLHRGSGIPLAGESGPADIEHHPTRYVRKRLARPVTWSATPRVRFG